MKGPSRAPDAAELPSAPGQTTREPAVPTGPAADTDAVGGQTETFE